MKRIFQLGRMSNFSEILCLSWVSDFNRGMHYAPDCVSMGNFGRHRKLAGRYLRLNNMKLQFVREWQSGHKDIMVGRMEDGQRTLIMEGSQMLHKY